MLESVDVFVATKVTEGLRHVKVACPDADTEKEPIAGAVTFSKVLVEQPLTSVTVTVFVPGVNPEAIEPLLVGVTVPGVGSHETVNPLDVEPPPTTAVEVPGGFRQEG